MITHCLRDNYIKLLIHYTLKSLLRRYPCGCNLNGVVNVLNYFNKDIAHAIIVNDWNEFPAEIVEADSINSFKNKLDKHWIEKVYETPFY